MKRQDYYYHLAKKENYRSRAAYKLKEIDEKFYIFKDGMNVLDLGAAPGGWTQVVLEKVKKGKIFSLDIKKINVSGVKSIKADVFDKNVFSLIENELKKENIDGFDVIISDMAPKISGIKEIDHQRSLDLGKRAFEISQKFLKERGSIVIKLFQGQDLENFKKEIEKNFDFCKFYGPRSSRKGSREIYLVCKRFKGSF